jgi:hypothetical protein
MPDISLVTLFSCDVWQDPHSRVRGDLFCTGVFFDMDANAPVIRHEQVW